VFAIINNYCHQTLHC